MWGFNGSEDYRYEAAYACEVLPWFMRHHGNMHHILYDEQVLVCALLLVHNITTALLLPVYLRNANTSAGPALFSLGLVIHRRRPGPRIQRQAPLGTARSSPSTSCQSTNL